MTGPHLSEDASEQDSELSVQGSDERSHSPIRPAPQAVRLPVKPRLVPAKPPTGPLGEAQQQSTDVSPSQVARLDPQQTLEHLRQRMTTVAEEFAQGKINRAQFHAIYNRYGEQRRIIERLLARDPSSSAWKTVARPGHTGFLRQHFAARLLFFALLPLGHLMPIVQYGKHPPRPQDVLPILKGLPDLIKKKGPLGPAKKRVTGGNWLVVVPGEHTVSVVLYSLEPSAQQIAQIKDLHDDFERANIHILARGDYAQERLVFPQRALFEA